VRRNTLLLNHHTMAIVSVPDVVVLEAVQVNLEVVTTHVNVSDVQKRYVKYTIRTTSV